MERRSRTDQIGFAHWKASGHGSYPEYRVRQGDDGCAVRGTGLSCVTSQHEHRNPSKSHSLTSHPTQKAFSLGIDNQKGGMWAKCVVVNLYFLHCLPENPDEVHSFPLDIIGLLCLAQNRRSCFFPTVSSLCFVGRGLHLSIVIGPACEADHVCFTSGKLIVKQKEPLLRRTSTNNLHRDNVLEKHGQFAGTIMIMASSGAESTPSSYKAAYSAANASTFSKTACRSLMAIVSARSR